LGRFQASLTTTRTFRRTRAVTGTVLGSIGALMQIGATIWIARRASRTESPRSNAAVIGKEPPLLAGLEL
jgi:hypothetical protein